MVLELIAARLLAPYIGVSLYTWTSIIGVILAGIALGNYLGGKIADRFASPSVLAMVFLAGALATVAVLPVIKVTASAQWFNQIPTMLSFVTKVLCIFFLPAVVLSMVSPMVIKLTLADLGRTGGIVGTIYAFSTAGSILGTFLTGFYFILWFGTRTTVWLIAAVLILTGVLAWFSWRVSDRWCLSPRNLVVWLTALGVITASTLLYQFPRSWQEVYTKESNYYAIRVVADKEVKILYLDRLVHSIVVPNAPGVFSYSYLRTFADIVEGVTKEDQAPRVLHLGGGGYSLPRYLELTYPQSTNEVVEIDPAVTQVAYEQLGLPWETSIKTYNQDARLFLTRRDRDSRYDIVIGDVFTDLSTPFHLTTLEFDRLVKANMERGGLYLVNIIDDYYQGRYMPSFTYTLQRAFDYVYLFGAPVGSTDESEYAGKSTFVIAASDQPIDFSSTYSLPLTGERLTEFLAKKGPLLLTDDYAPTDILVAPLFKFLH